MKIEKLVSNHTYSSPIYASAKPLSSLHTSSLSSSSTNILGKVKDGILFFPLLAWRIAKKIVYLLSCCTLCKETLSTQQKLDVAQDLLQTWKKRGATEEQKAKAWAEVTRAWPYLEDDLVAAHVEMRAAKALGSKGSTPEKIQEWSQEHYEEVKKSICSKIVDYNVNCIERYIGFLERVLQEEMNK